jgi:thymidylate kinase
MVASNAKVLIRLFIPTELRQMIVEFIGCTGAGKTTLIGQVQSRLAETTPVITAHEVIASRVGLNALGNPTAQNLVEELVGFPFFLRALGRHRAYLTLTLRMFMRDARLSFTTLNNLRSLERKLGGYEITLRHQNGGIVLVDEGPIQAAHMFAANADSLSDGDIHRFAELLPMPDLVVYVKSPVDALMDRTSKRSDPPREVRSQHATATERHLKGAVDVFDRLVHASNLCGRVLIVENTDLTQKEYSALAGELAASILNRRAVHYDGEVSANLIPETL